MNSTYGILPGKLSGERILLVRENNLTSDYTSYNISLDLFVGNFSLMDVTVVFNDSNKSFSINENAAGLKVMQMLKFGITPAYRHQCCHYCLFKVIFLSCMGT